MKILQLDNINFGTLRIEQPVKFSPNLNLWLAQNQAGKTTLLTLIEWMLYGAPAKRGAKDPAAIKHWTPWNGGQPSGRIVILPELPDWPGEVLVSARFADGLIQLSEFRTQKTLPDRVSIAKSGEWNLGQLLLNLSRDSYRNALVAYQGQLTELLEHSTLRSMLTSDLGGLVVNPDIAQADRIIAALENPTFTLGNGEARGIREHTVQITKELDFIELEKRGLEQRLGEFRDVLARRDASTLQLQQQEQLLAGLDRQMQQLDLARNYYLLRAGQAVPAAAVDRDENVQTELPPISPDLERDVDNLAVQLEAAELQLTRIRKELAEAEAQLQILQEQRSGAGSGREGASSILQLQEAAVRVEAAQEELAQAQRRNLEFEARIPAKVQSRYAELSRLFEPHRANLAAIGQWQKETVAINEQLALLRERRVELQILSRIALPKSFYVGFGLIALAVFMPFISGMFGMFGFLPWLIAGIVLLIAVFCISPYWRMRRATGPAATELKNNVNPAIEHQTGLLTAQDRKRRRFIELYETDRPTWDKLVDNVTEYTQLGLNMRELESAQRDLETIRRRRDVAWQEVCSLLPLAPVAADLDWLRAQLSSKLGTGAGPGDLRLLEARLNQLRLDERQTATLQQELSRAIAEKLDPLGLGTQLKSSLRGALDAFRSLADRVRLAAQSKDRQQLLGDSLKGVVMDSAEFDEQWSQLSGTEQSRIMSMVQTRDGFESACSRLQEVNRARKAAEQKREELYRTADEVREQLAAFGRIDLEAEAMQRRNEEARTNRQLVERWDQALKTTARLIDSMVNRATQDIAPEIDRALRQVLESAPIQGLREVRLGKNLELEITLAGAPSGLPAEELVSSLSEGARQQLALALRLAMARVASGRTDLPLLLDEPLSELDDERAKLAFAYMSRLAEKTQILITSCHELQYRWLAESAVKVAQLNVVAKSAG